VELTLVYQQLSGCPVDPMMAVGVRRLAACFSYTYPSTAQQVSKQLSSADKGCYL
jgi:hypothetical protein